ncbi:hypothetical protein Dimus_000705, partial [Dionaea muscipula]
VDLERIWWSSSPMMVIDLVVGNEQRGGGGDEMEKQIWANPWWLLPSCSRGGAAVSLGWPTVVPLRVDVPRQQAR